MIVLEWILFYLVPAAVVFVVARRYHSFKIRAIIIHAGLIVSIILLTVAGAWLRWEFEVIPFLCLLGAAAIAIYLLSKFGLVYAASSIIQEWCLLLAGVLLIGQIGLPGAAFLSAFVYAAAHLIRTKHGGSKFFITLAWGVCSILLYAWIQQPMLNFAIHIIGGSILIKKGLLYGRLES